MAETPSDQSSRESRIDDAIARYLEQAERGHPPDQQEYIAQHPDLAAELQSFFADRAQFQQVAGELAPRGAAIEPKSENQTPASPTPVSATPGHRADPSPATMAWKDRSRDWHENVVRYFGDYELLEEIARGGMGVVFKARQTSLNRIVAVKMILSGQLASPEDVQRFRTEAEAAAQLDHPGIVPIYEVGVHEGQHYFAMGFVDGASLAARVTQGPLPPREAAEIVRAVAVAVQYAHDHGVIHRDLKPGNVLLDKDGKPRVTDFGLAKLTESGSDLTGTGQILGTPSYMPPEQAAAQVSAVSRLSDVYSLGAVLYCLLTGRPPFQAANPLETLLQVQKQEPVAPRQLNPNLPLDLDTIVLKCLDKSPTRRYASARLLVDELSRYLDGRPILARRVSRPERFRRWSQREPIVASLSAAVLLALLIGTAVSAYFAIKERNRANENRKLAGENESLSKSEYDTRIKEEHERIKAQRQQRIAIAEKLAALSYSKRLESPEVSLLLAVESGRATQLHEEGLVLSSRHALLDALYEIGGRPLIGHQAAITSLTISTDGRWIVTGSVDTTARVWDLAAANPAANPIVLSGHRQGISSLVISPDGRWIVTGSGDTTARVWDLMAANPAINPTVLTGHEGGITSVAISPDSHWIVTGSTDTTARVWDLTAGNPATNPIVLKGHRGGIICVAISADSRSIVTGATDDAARVWDRTADDPSANPTILSGHEYQTTSIAISPDGRWVVTVGSGSDIDRIRSIALSPDFGLKINDSARLWDLTADNPSANPRVLVGGGPVAISPDGRLIVTTAQDDTVRVNDLLAENRDSNLRVLLGHNDLVHNMVISSNSRWLVTGSNDRTARVWDLMSKYPSADARVLKGHQGPIANVAISPDSRWVVTSSYDTARVWDLDANHAIPRRLEFNRGDGSTRIWLWQWEALVANATKVGRNFTRDEWSQYFPGETYRKTFPELPIPGEP